MGKFLNTVQSFIHSVTTNDRYASYESQYDPNRSSNGHNRHGGVDEINGDSTHYLYSAYGGDQHPTAKDGFTRVGMNSIANGSSSSLDRLNTSVNNNSTTNNNNNNNNYSNNSANTSSTSLNRIPYTPGLRSQQLGNGHIPLQDYAEGTPLPPSPTVSWSRIDRWVEANYPELYDQLSYPVTSADLNELEADLDCSLPLEVRDSYLIRDGQERGGKPTGLFFSITLLQLEGIVEEWSIWRKTAIKVNEALKRQKMHSGQLPPQPSSSKSNHPQSTTTATATGIAWLDRQESVPENAIQRVYAHPAWIPLAKDWEGNNIAIDLAPGPKGRWGQVILFGRDFDRKYVIASSWAAFLATFADDLELGNHYINDDIEEGQMMFRTPNGRIVSYFNVLRSRVDRQIGQVRKQVVRQSPPGMVPSAAAAQSRRPPSASGSKSPSPVINSMNNTTSANDGHSNNGARKLSSPKPREGSGSLISPAPSTTSLPLPSTGLSTSSSLEKEREKDKQEEEVKGEGNSDNLVEQKHDKEEEQEEQKVQVQPEANEVSKEQTKESELVKQEPTKQPKSEPTDPEEQDEVDMLNDELSDVEI